MNKTILIADDDKCSLNLLKKYFSMAGFTVYTAETCRDVMRYACDNLPDCFLLDYHLKDDDALTACSFIRNHARLKNAPIAILSGDADQAAGSYDACQADVFFEKPARYAEILAGIRRQLRRTEAAGGVVRSADVTLDPVNLRIVKDGKTAVSLSWDQFRLFSVLFERSPKFVSEMELLAVLFFPAGSGTPTAFKMLAYRLRAKLGTRLARRIKCKKNRGWVYVQPRRNLPPVSKPLRNVSPA